MDIFYNRMLRIRLYIFALSGRKVSLLLFQFLVMMKSFRLFIFGVWKIMDWRNIFSDFDFFANVTESTITDK